MRWQPVRSAVATVVACAVVVTVGASAARAAVPTISSFSPGTAPALAGIGGVSCPAVEVCFAIGGEAGFPQGKGVIIGTADGGARWKVLGQPAGPHIFYGITCPTALYCKVAGIGPSDAGTVYTTRDGGAVWAKDPVELGGEPFLAIACHAPQTCEAAGGGVGQLTLSRSGVPAGRRWRNQDAPPLVVRSIPPRVPRLRITPVAAAQVRAVGQATPLAVPPGNTCAVHRLPPSAVLATAAHDRPCAFLRSCRRAA